MGSVDKYVYPGTNVLINLFDCHDGLELEKLEALSTGANLAWLQLHPISGSFDFKHLNILASTMNSKGEKHVRQADIGDYQRKLR